MTERTSMMTTYAPSGAGFAVAAMYDKWRVATSAYCDIVDKQLLYRLECHDNTDEVFILARGMADSRKIRRQTRKTGDIPNDGGMVYNIRNID